MSRGSGRIEQAIIAAFTAEPDNAFTVAELAVRIYPDDEYIEKKHRVAIIRAATSLSRRWPDLGWQHSEMRGREKVFFNADSIMSFAMARLKGDNLKIDESEEKLRASLLKGGHYHEYIVKGGAWRRHRDMWIAQRDGDTARLKELEAEQDRALNEIATRMHLAQLKIKG